MKKWLWGLVACVALAFSLSILAAAANGPVANATYSKDVAPIIYNRCAECHRPSGIAPMSFMTYQEVRPWARSIKEKVANRTMPPWFADHQYSEFANNPSLSQKEIDTIVNWVTAGSPRGDDKDMPATPRFVEGWSLGKPDVILSMGEEFSVPAEGEVPYMYFTIPTNFKEDRWLQGIEIRPSAPSVVHHVIAYSQEAGAQATGGRQSETQRGRVHLAGITPNKTGIMYAPGIARLLKAGSSIILQMHYTPTGRATTDRTRVGFIFAKESPKQAVTTGSAANARFVIPAGDPNYEVTSSTTFKEDTWLHSFSPHMHVRGKDFIYTAVYPDGKKQVILNVPRFDFNWQLTYTLKQPVLMPKGTRLDCVAHFDNSAGNKFNPDPSKEVRWGDQTWEEMMIGWFNTVRDLKPEESKADSTASLQR